MPLKYASGSVLVAASVQATSHSAKKALSQRMGGEPIDKSATTEINSPGSHALTRELSL